MVIEVVYKCFLCATLLAMIAASSLYASGLLSLDEMQEVQGGSSQLYCKSFTCGSGSETCKQDTVGRCDPTIPSEACNNNEIKHTTVNDCGSPIGPGTTCSQGSLTECPNSSGLYKCSCVISTHKCTKAFDSHYYYNPCQ
jgi:hypothetical protein